MMANKGDFITAYAIFTAINRDDDWSWNGHDFTPDEFDRLEFNTSEEAEEEFGDLGDCFIEQYSRPAISSWEAERNKRARAHLKEEPSPFLMAAE